MRAAIVRWPLLSEHLLQQLGLSCPRLPAYTLTSTLCPPPSSKQASRGSRAGQHSQATWLWHCVESSSGYEVINACLELRIVQPMIKNDAKGFGISNAGCICPQFKNQTVGTIRCCRIKSKIQVRVKNTACICLANDVSQAAGI